MRFFFLTLDVLVAVGVGFTNFFECFVRLAISLRVLFLMCSPALKAHLFLLQELVPLAALVGAVSLLTFLP